MPRYYRSRRGGKFSNNTVTISRENTTTNVPAGAVTSVAVVPTTAVFGTRKVKNFKICISCYGFHRPVVWALIYVPQGTNPANFAIVSGDNVMPELYNPNQNVIMQGLCNPEDPHPCIATSRLARNLDSGDSIYLVWAPVWNETEVDQNHALELYGTVNYSIKY